ncbi:acyl-CoA N-acyltransferase [Dactylonectria estremocensis]|uniref:Acyl-CoA N-acyltransferase n=1 Tax=Dactylonectria estremocensis TaxID=1079267 RepID=A0A9P9DNP0_9HYPO|nr:acyl-CoA N-acyltransferase [Dactylonectria estremocensis]
MPFTLLEVDFAADFSDVIECQWLSYEQPLQKFFRMFCPLSGDGPAARAESLRESVAFQLDWHRTDPAGHWRKVVDENGKIVGACLWKIYKTNPFEKPDDHTGAEWYPEGETREYVNKCLEQFDAPRRGMAARPHVYLNILFTHPDYRRRGVADLMLAWGIQRADEMGVEMWLDSTACGVPVYLKHGFLVVNENRVRPTKDEAGEAWRKLDQELQPMAFWQMWRPVGGIYDEGKTVKPWV